MMPELTSIYHLITSMLTIQGSILFLITDCVYMRHLLADLSKTKTLRYLSLQ